MGALFDRYTVPPFLRPSREGVTLKDLQGEASQGGQEGSEPEQGGDPPVQGDLIQDFEWPSEEWKRPTFKDCAAVETSAAFFNGDEHAEEHNVDGKDVLVILDKSDVRDHSAHWEAGAKQNFDAGLYNLHIILYIRVEDYGPKPKQGKRLTLDQKLTYSIQKCEEESGVYRMTLERTRQG